MRVCLCVYSCVCEGVKKKTALDLYVCVHPSACTETGADVKLQSCSLASSAAAGAGGFERVEVTRI